MKILVINGPNINMLGIREPEIYGRQSYGDLLAFIAEAAAAEGVTADCFQSNHEGAIVDAIQNALGIYDGIVINPAAYTHTSIAVADALKAVSLPAVEVHLSDPDTRESFRHISFVRSACIAVFSGFGFEGYRKALHCLATRK